MALLRNCLSLLLVALVATTARAQTAPELEAGALSERNANYTIEVVLDPSDKTLTGSPKVVDSLIVGE